MAASYLQPLSTCHLLGFSITFLWHNFVLIPLSKYERLRMLASLRWPTRRCPSKTSHSLTCSLCSCRNMMLITWDPGHQTSMPWRWPIHPFCFIGSTLALACARRKSSHGVCVVGRVGSSVVWKHFRKLEACASIGSSVGDGDGRGETKRLFAFIFTWLLMPS